MLAVTPTEGKPKLEQCRDYFLHFDPAQWEEVSTSLNGYLTFIDDSGDEFSLFVFALPGSGIGLMYDAYYRVDDQRRGEEWLSLGNPARLSTFVDVDDEVFMPLGSLLEPATAWMGVEDFLQQPTIRSSRIAWVNSNELSWPGW